MRLCKPMSSEDLANSYRFFFFFYNALKYLHVKVFGEINFPPERNLSGFIKSFLKMNKSLESVKVYTSLLMVCGYLKAVP